MLRKGGPDVAEQYIRGEDLVLTGCDDENYNGMFWVAESDPKVNNKPHYVNASNCHIYFARDEMERAALTR